MRVFVTGGTGLVGTRLVERLLGRGDAVAVLTRRPDSARAKWGPRCTIVQGDPTATGPWQDGVKDYDAVVHLAGEGIFNQRWNADFKQRLYDSRIKSTDNVVAALARQPTTAAGRPKTLVSASAIGYYGPHDDLGLAEDSAPGSDFLAQLCVDWEKAARAASAQGVRVVIVRVGVVLDPAGGALAKMMPPFKFFVGGPIGSGKQYVSWIHADDLVGEILHALDHAEVEGPLNGTAPHPVTNKEFSRALGRALHRPSFLPAPGFGLRLMLGEAARIITQGQRVLPHRAQQAGYSFRFPEVDAALQDLLKK